MSDLHRRIGEINTSDDVPTLCGRTVNYQRASGSLTNVDCPACVLAADRLVDHYVRELRELLGPALEKLTRQARS